MVAQRRSAGGVELVAGRGRARATPRAPRARPSRDRILRAARRVFAGQGYGETSLRQLMQASETSTTAFYARFASKEDVLTALVLDLVSELEQRAAAELSSAQSLEDGFRRGADVLAEVLKPEREVVRLALTEAAAVPEVARTVSRVYSSLAALLASRLRHLVERERIEPVDAEVLAWALVGAVNVQVIRWAVWRDLPPEKLAPALRATAQSLLPVLRPAKSARKPRRNGGERR